MLLPNTTTTLDVSLTSRLQLSSLDMADALRDTSASPMSRHEILRLLAYHRNDYDSSVLCILSERNPSRMHAVDSAHRPSLSDLGGLDVLPVETLDTVLRVSDLRTLLTLRLVNRQAKAVVETFTPYKHILTHTPHVVDIFTRTGVASHFTAVQVFDALGSDSCTICGRFGAFLWVPDCIRCCLPCVRVSPELMPMTERDAGAAFGLSRKALSTIPIMHTLPGVYTLSEIPYKRRRRLLSRKRAREVAVEVHGGEEGLVSYINSNTSPAKIAYDQRVAKWNATRSCFGPNREINNTIDHVSRFLVTIHLPFFSSESRSTETGLSCKGCQAALERGLKQVLSSVQVDTLLDRRDRTFTEEMFLNHLAVCTDAQRMWAEYHTSNGRASS